MESSCADRYLGDEILTRYSLIAAITDWVLPALSALFAVLMTAASAAVEELVVVVVFPRVAVPVPLPVEFPPLAEPDRSKNQPVPYDPCRNSWCSSAPDILSTALAGWVPVHRYYQGISNCTIRH